MTGPIVKTESKVLFKGQLFGALSNGGAIIDIENGYGLKFVSVNDKFCQIILLDHGLGIPVKTQSWQKSKVVKQTVIKEVIKKPEKVKEEVEFKNNQEQETLF